MSANDERRLAYVRACLKGGSGVRWRGFGHGTPTPTEVATLAYSLRRGCTFEDDTRRTGCIEHRGMRVNFEVGDEALVVTRTGETMEPRHVARLRSLAALEQKRRAAQRAVNTQKHRRWRR